jgi:hypothetical protein
MPAAAASYVIAGTSQVPPDGEAIFGRLTVQVAGSTALIGAFVRVPFGASYAVANQTLRDAAVAAALEQAGIVIAPEDPVQIFGGPQPTLADLGG